MLEIYLDPLIYFYTLGSDRSTALVTLNCLFIEHIRRHAGSNPCLLQCKYRFLTTGLTRKSQELVLICRIHCHSLLVCNLTFDSLEVILGGGFRFLSWADFFWLLFCSISNLEILQPFQWTSSHDNYFATVFQKRWFWRFFHIWYIYKAHLLHELLIP